MGSFHWLRICAHGLSSIGGEEISLESVLSISPMADLRDHVSSPQGAGLIVLSMGDGTLTHSSVR
jgi:hypothetical protein